MKTLPKRLRVEVTHRNIRCGIQGSPDRDCIATAIRRTTGRKEVAVSQAGIVIDGQAYETTDRAIRFMTAWDQKKSSVKPTVLVFRRVD